MTGRERCPRCKGRGRITVRPNLGAFLFWWIAVLLGRPFFETELCPVCGGTGRSPWTLHEPD
ncbi:MAG: hypothetical protein ACXVPL_10355 [Actinomycetota bacterium]